MGAPPFVYPKEAGLPFGGPAANKYVMLEVHYNNPEMLDGKFEHLKFVKKVTKLFNLNKKKLKQE